MKNQLLSLAAILLFTIAATAQTPPQMNCQAVVRNGTIGMVTRTTSDHTRATSDVTRAMSDDTRAMSDDTRTSGYDI